MCHIHVAFRLRIPHSLVTAGSSPYDFLSRALRRFHAFFKFLPVGDLRRENRFKRLSGHAVSNGDTFGSTCFFTSALWFSCRESKHAQLSTSPQRYSGKGNETSAGGWDVVWQYAYLEVITIYPSAPKQYSNKTRMRREYKTRERKIQIKNKVAENGANANWIQFNIFNNNWLIGIDEILLILYLIYIISEHKVYIQYHKYINNILYYINI